MRKQQKNPQYRWNLLLAGHVILYLMAWGFAIHSLSILPAVSFGSDYTHFIAGVMLWLPIFMLHVIVHTVTYRQNRQNEPLGGGRDAYLEGFADAVRQLKSRPDLVDRLAYDNHADEDELSAPLEKPKRGYSR